MKLATKLPLAFAAALLVLLGAALFGIAQLRQALTTYQTTVAVHADQERAVNHMLDSFKLQTQEWKNVLLRGATSAACATGAPLKSRRPWCRRLPPLLAGLPAGDSRSRVEGFAQAHQRMGQAYAAATRLSRPPAWMRWRGPGGAGHRPGTDPSCWMRPVADPAQRRRRGRAGRHGRHARHLDQPGGDADGLRAGHWHGPAVQPCGGAPAGCRWHGRWRTAT
jgi:hypothetical protein